MNGVTTLRQAQGERISFGRPVRGYGPFAHPARAFSGEGISSMDV